MPKFLDGLSVRVKIESGIPTPEKTQSKISTEMSADDGIAQGTRLVSDVDNPPIGHPLPAYG